MSLGQIALGDLKDEFGKTRTMLERVPEEHFGWKPHERSWSLAQISTHIANLPVWVLMTISEDGYDMKAASPPRPEPQTHDELLATFDDNAANAMSALSGATDAVLTEGWSLRAGEQVFWTRPKVEIIREWGISHMVHHRGQLSVYLRLLDVPLPPIFGPTADEQPGP